MEIIDISSAANRAIKKLAANGQIGSTTPIKTYTFDGNPNGHIVVPFQDTASLVKVSDEMPNIREIRRMSIGDSPLDDNLVDLNFADGTPENNVLWGASGTVIFAALPFMGEVPFVVVITDTLDSPIPSTGLYFFYMEGNTWVSGMEVGGNVTPIDPKYYVKTIDLTKYTFELYGNPVSLNLAVLSTFQQSGGSVEGTVQDFWSDVSTNQALRFVIDGTEANMPIKIEVDGATKIINAYPGEWYDKVTQITIRFGVIAPEMGLNHDIVIVFNRTDDNGTERTGISLTMTPVGSAATLANAEGVSF